MSKINKSDKYAVLWLNSQGYSIDNISKELKLTEVQIKNIVKKYIDDQPRQDKIPTTSSSVSGLSNPKHLMITESQSGKHKVAVMTKAASELSDEARKTNTKQSYTKPLPHIYRPNGS